MSSAILEAVDKRYSGLATKSTCLSCGGAVKHAAVQKGEYCLDLGSGRGRDAVRMAKETGGEGFVWGVDLSDAMRNEALDHAKSEEVYNLRFLAGELEKLPLPSSSVDVVISNCVLNHARDKAAVWDEIHRVLKPGGRFVISDIYATHPVPEKYRNDPAAISECWGGADTRSIYLATVSCAGFPKTQILEESEPYDKGHIQVASFTLKGTKPRY